MNDHNNDSDRQAPGNRPPAKGASWREKLGLTGGRQGGSPRDLLAGRVRPAPAAGRERPEGDGEKARPAPAGAPVAGAGAAQAPGGRRPVVRPAPLAPRKPVVRPRGAAEAGGGAPAGKSGEGREEPVLRGATGPGSLPAKGARAGSAPPPPPPPPPRLRRGPGGITPGKPRAEESGEGARPTSGLPPVSPARAVRDDDFARRLRAQREAAERLAAQRMARLKGSEPGTGRAGAGAAAVSGGSPGAGTRTTAVPPAGGTSAGEGTRPAAPHPGRRRLPFTFADAETEAGAETASSSAMSERPADVPRETGARPVAAGEEAETAAAASPKPGGTAAPVAEASEAGSPAGPAAEPAAGSREGKGAGVTAPAGAMPPPPAVAEGEEVADEGAENVETAGPVSTAHEETPREDAYDEVGMGMPAGAGRARPEDYVSALEELEAEPPGRGRKVVFMFILALLLVFAVAAGAIFFYRTFSGGGKDGATNVPVIAPETKPVKTAPPKPETPRQQQPVRRKKIYDRILGDDVEQGPSRLAPSEEKPLTPPPAPAPDGNAGPAEPLPLPLPPPPALDGGQGGQLDTRGEPQETRTAGLPLPPPPPPPADMAAAGQEAKTTETAGTAAAPAGENGKARALARKTSGNAKTAGAGDAVSEAASEGAGEAAKKVISATDLPLPPPPVPDVPATAEPAAGDGAQALDAEGLARLAARAAEGEEPGAAGGVTVARPAKGGDEAGAGGARPAASGERPGVMAGSNGGREKARDVAVKEGQAMPARPPQRPMPATAIRRTQTPARKVAETPRRKTRAERRERRAQSPRRTQRAERTAAATAKRGPRSILPPGVSGVGTGGRTRVAAAPPAPATGPKPIVPAPVLRPGAAPRKVTNFSSGRGGGTAASLPPAGTRGGVVAPTAPQRVAPQGVMPQRVAPARQRVAAVTTPVPARPPRTGGGRAGKETGGGGYLVQLAAYRSREDALRAYQRLQARHGGLLGGMSPRIERKDLGAAGTFYRLAVGPLPTRAEARRLCNALIARGEKDCLVRRR